MKDDSQPVTTELVVKSPLRKRNLASGVTSQNMHKTNVHREENDVNKLPRKEEIKNTNLSAKKSDIEVKVAHPKKKGQQKHNGRKQPA